MNTMIDRWNRIKVSAEGEAQSHPDELRASRCEGQAHAIKIAIDDFVDACTPREPKQEWFEKWDAWWIDVQDPIVDPFCARVSEGYCMRTLAKIADRGAIRRVVPVAHEGFPAPVGWKVVES